MTKWYCGGAAKRQRSIKSIVVALKVEIRCEIDIFFYHMVFSGNLFYH